MSRTELGICIIGWGSQVLALGALLLAFEVIPPEGFAILSVVWVGCLLVGTAVLGTAE